MKKFSVKDIEDIIKNDCWEYKIEEECNAWGCVTPHYQKLINPGELLNVLRKKAKNEVKENTVA